MTLDLAHAARQRQLRHPVIQILAWHVCQGAKHRNAAGVLQRMGR